MANKNLDLTIIILNYNGLDWLKLTLESLDTFYLKKTKYQVEVVVVDNHSSDGSIEFLQKQHIASTMLLKDNLGFAAGNNVALKTVTSRYTMLLNSDTQFDQRSNLDHLIEYLDDHTDVDVISPLLLLTSGQIDLASHRGEPTLMAAVTYFLGLESKFPQVKAFSKYHLLDRDFAATHRIDACSGAAMIVRTSQMKKIGLLDERFFFYAEDLDWCKRFRENGGKIVYFPSVVVIHHKYKSGQKNQDKQIAQKTHNYFYDTMIQYFEKHYAKQYPKIVTKLVKIIINIKKGVS
jgi:GT2 family glycosyltransferase